jgi:hypothetical protein
VGRVAVICSVVGMLVAWLRGEHVTYPKC